MQGVASLWGWSMGVFIEGTRLHPGLINEYASCLLHCKSSQHQAIGMQTDCMVIVPAPVVRLPDSHVYALWA